MQAVPATRKLVTLVADAGPQAGLGHISRSSALAVALRCRGVESRCYASGALEIFERDGVRWLPSPSGTLPALAGGVLVVDSYVLSRGDLERAAQSSRLVVMHDYGDVPGGTALVVSPATEDGTRRLGGFEHVSLRPGFWGLPERQIHARADRILVSTGSGTFDSLGHEVAGSVASALPAAVVTLVRGPYATASIPPQDVEILDAPDSLVDALMSADLVVTAGGQTMLEAGAVGTPSIVLPVVENQRRQVDRLAALGAVVVVDPPTANEIAAAAVELAHDEARRRILSRTSHQAIDGYGALRIAFQIDRLARDLH